MLHERVGLVLPQNPVEYVHKRIKAVVASNRNLKMAVDVCVHCGVCLDNCPTYVRTKDLFNSPVGRAELVRAVIKADSASGKLFGKLEALLGLTRSNWRRSTPTTTNVLNVGNVPTRVPST